jgi:hypothetical protein
VTAAAATRRDNLINGLLMERPTRRGTPESRHIVIDRSWPEPYADTVVIAAAVPLGLGAGSGADNRNAPNAQNFPQSQTNE